MASSRPGPRHLEEEGVQQENDEETGNRHRRRGRLRDELGRIRQPSRAYGIGSYGKGKGSKIKVWRSNTRRGTNGGDGQLDDELVTGDAWC